MEAILLTRCFPPDSELLRYLHNPGSNSEGVN